MSLRARLMNTWLRRVEKPIMSRARDQGVLRRRFNFYGKYFFHAPRGTETNWLALRAGKRLVDALEVKPRSLNGERVLLYIHGGGFVFGSPDTHSALVAQLALRLETRAILPRYRLAPEHPFPAAPEDVRIAWDALRASGVQARDIVIGGDSAGGALALGLLAELCGQNADLPGGVFCFSPLTDLTYSGASFIDNAETEAVLAANRASDMMEMYLRGQPADDPSVSPLFAGFEGAPPVWITVGDTEILLDDARRMAVRLREFGAPVTLQEEHDLPHVWPIFHNTLPEAQQTLDQLADWIRQLPGWQGGS